MTKIGILGGGQLGAMLATAAERIGLKPLVYMEDALAPAARTNAVIRLGRHSDSAKLREFFSEAGTIAFENEFVDCATLEAAAQGLKTDFHPSLGTIAILQNKFSQKKLLTELKIPTAAFREVQSAEAALRVFPEGCVLKWAKLGYDGKGVFFLTPENANTSQSFFTKPLAAGITVYAEQKIAFRRELACIAVRSRDGDFKTWPLVVSEQTNGICRRVYGPATALGVDQKLETEAFEFARRIGDHLKIVGVFALELFETESGELVVNEIAPRVHNSGHFTMDGSRTSQFENHVRAVAGLQLQDVSCQPAFAMLNLLGPEGVERAEKGAPLPQTANTGIRLHWYGKSYISPRRKLGHLNAASESAQDLPALLDALEKCHSEWVEALRRT